MRGAIHPVSTPILEFLCETSQMRVVMRVVIAISLLST